MLHLAGSLDWYTKSCVAYSVMTKTKLVMLTWGFDMTHYSNYDLIKWISTDRVPLQLKVVIVQAGNLPQPLNCSPQLFSSITVKFCVKTGCTEREKKKTWVLSCLCIVFYHVVHIITTVLIYEVHHTGRPTFFF